MAALFYAVALPFGAVFLWGLLRLLRRIRGATPQLEDQPEDQPEERPGERPLPGRAGRRGSAAAAGRLLRLAVLQRRLQASPLARGTHLAISGGFAVLLLGSLLVLVDDHLLRPLGTGLPAGRFLQLFQAVLDLFGLALVAGVAAALAGRHPRFRRRPGRPERPTPGAVATAVLATLLFLGLSGFLLEALRLAEGGGEGSWAFAGRALAALPALADAPAAFRAGAYRALWWTHAVVALGLVAAIPFTALRHLVAAPVQLWLSSEASRPAARTPFDLRQLLAGGPLDVRVGVASGGDLPWRDRLALAACTECGACDLACPAVASGSALAPRRLVRSLWQACGASNGHGEAAPDLFAGAVTPEEVWACTLCAACSRACPVLVRPPEAVLELRRELVTRNRLPAHGAEVLASLARCGNPYGLPHREREGLAAALGVPTLAEDPDVEVLYWLGCATAYDPRARRVAEAMVALLRRAGVRFGVLGAEERCTGDAARRMGEEGRFQELALQNLETFERYGVRKVLTHCAHCFDALRNDYPELGGTFETVHHTAFLDELVRSGRLVPGAGAPRRATLHDACCACRFNGLGDEPRRVLAAVPGLSTVEMPRSREDAFCCGGGGAGYWYDTPRREPVAALRLAEAAATGAEVLVVECPFCLRELEGAAGGGTAAPGLVVRDLAELMAESVA